MNKTNQVQQGAITVFALTQRSRSLPGVRPDGSLGLETYNFKTPGAPKRDSGARFGRMSRVLLSRGGASVCCLWDGTHGFLVWVSYASEERLRRLWTPIGSIRCHLQRVPTPLTSCAFRHPGLTDTAQSRSAGAPARAVPTCPICWRTDGDTLVRTLPGALPRATLCVTPQCGNAHYSFDILTLLLY